MPQRRRCCWRGAILNWIENYDDIQRAAKGLLYAQVAVGLLGSLSAMYTGLILANLCFALFALVAIEAGSQALGRAYAVFLGSSIITDILWFMLYGSEIRHSGSLDGIGPRASASLHLALAMQGIGFVLRVVSTAVWFQMYRLGRSALDAAQFPAFFEGGGSSVDNDDNDLADRLLERRESLGNEFLGGGLYPAAGLSPSTLLQQYCAPDGQLQQQQQQQQQQPQGEKSEGGYHLSWGIPTTACQPPPSTASLPSSMEPPESFLPQVEVDSRMVPALHPYHRGIFAPVTLTSKSS